MVKSAMPTTFHSAVVLAGSLTDEMVWNGSLENLSAGGKRQWTGNLNIEIEESPSKRNNQDTVKSYTGIAKEGRKPYRGTLPECIKCGAHHLGGVCQETICY